MKYFIVLCFSALSFSCVAQEKKDSLLNEMFFYGDVMLNAIEFENRSFAGSKFHNAFDLYVQEYNGYELNTNQIKTISILENGDKTFKLMSWQVGISDNESRYFAYLFYPDGEYVELKDEKGLDEVSPYASLSTAQWYGALYYNLMKIDDNNYLVFGFGKLDQYTNVKLVDVLSFTDQGVHLGSPYFEDKTSLGTYCNRVVLSYSSDATVNLNYNPSMEMIVHDHLSQRMGRVEGQGPTNLPDGTYEGYIFTNGLWKYKEKLFDHSYGENNAPRPLPVFTDKKKGLFGQ